MIGKNIGEIRKSRGYSLTQLAERSNVSKSYLSNIERSVNKNPSIKVLNRIAKVLDVDLKILLIKDQKAETPTSPGREWAELINELKETGINKEELKEYKILLEFIKWKKRNKQEND